MERESVRDPGQLPSCYTQLRIWGLERLLGPRFLREGPRHFLLTPGGPFPDFSHPRLRCGGRTMVPLATTVRPRVAQHHAALLGPPPHLPHHTGTVASATSITGRVRMARQHALREGHVHTIITAHGCSGSISNQLLWIYYCAYFVNGTL